jgi:hypothetical protein
MRRRLIEALTYPRLFVLNNIDSNACPHDGCFNSGADDCHNCTSQQECHWLRCLDSFADFSRMPEYTIHASLLFGMSLIEQHNERIKHDTDGCSCESCTWVRGARQLAQEFQTGRPDRLDNPDHPASSDRI